MGNQIARPASPQPHSQHSPTHPICCTCRNDPEISEKEQNSLIQLPCSHFHCKSCLSDQVYQYFHVKLRSFIAIPCDFSTCEGKLPLDIVMDVATDEDKARIQDLIDRTIPKEKKESYTLDEFGYFYNSSQQLRQIAKPDEGFFYITERHYDALGDAIVNHIQTEMEQKHGMIKVPVNEAEENYVFVSDGLDDYRKIIVLCCGSGAVKAGQWARALCINDSLQTGSILSYIKQAQELDYGVIVLNPNQTSVRTNPISLEERCDFLNPARIPHPKRDDVRWIENSGSGGEHFVWAWDNFVSKSTKVKDVSIVAHSAGGYHTLELLENRADEVKALVRGIGFTDAVHSVTMKDEFAREFLPSHAVNWVTSKQPLNEEVRQNRGSGCPLRSAGTTSHELTSSMCQKPLFEFLEEKIKEEQI